MARNELIFENAKRTAKENNVSVEAALIADLLVCQWKMLKDIQKLVEGNNKK